MTRHQAILVLCGGLLGNLPGGLQAGVVESYWIQPAPGGGLFTDPANWSGPVPDETVTAIFDLEAGFNFIGFDTGAVSDRVIIRAGDAQFLLWTSVGEKLVPLSYDMTNPQFGSPALVIGEDVGDVASLEIDFGVVSTTSTVLGLLPGSSGTLIFNEVLDFVPELSCESYLHVGDRGQGLLVVDQAVSITSDTTEIGAGLGGVGEMTMTEATSLDATTILSVGTAGQGTLTVSEGSTVTSGSSVVAAGNASIGDVTVSGPDSSWSMLGTLTVGQGGQATVTIDNDADLSSGAAVIGQNIGSVADVTVTGFGSSWTIEGSLDVGLLGDGGLTVCDGGVVFTNSFTTLGTFPDPLQETGGTGEVTVCGPGSFWFIDGDLYVGFLWQGTLNVLDGGTVSSQSGLVGFANAATGAVTVDGPGSLWGVGTGLTVAAGSLTVSNGGAVVGGSVFIGSGAELAGDGSILTGTSNGGIVRPGNPVGTLTIDGDYSDNTGELVIGIADANPGGFGALLVTGSASVGGTLTVSFLEGYVPQDGDTFDILAAATVTGTFNDMTLPVLDPPLFWQYNQDSDSIELVIMEAALCPWDCGGDNDGDVGIVDFLALLEQWKTPGSCDFDGGGVDIVDFLELLANWGPCP